MGRLQRLLTAGIAVAICFAADGASASADEDSVLRILAAGQQAMLERHYRQAVHVLRDGLKEYPGDNRLRLELGRAYLSAGADGRAIRLFREILGTEPDNRLAAGNHSWRSAQRVEFDIKPDLTNRLFFE